MEKVSSLEKLRQETEQAKLELQKQELILIQERKVAADVLSDDSSSPSGAPGSSMDDLSDLRLVPRFNERDPETFFCNV